MGFHDIGRAVGVRDGLRRHLQRFQQALHPADTLFRFRMAVKEAPARIAVFPGQLLELVHGDEDAVRAVPGLQGIFEPAAVRRAFVGPAVPGRQGVRHDHAGHHHIGAARGNARQDGRHLGPHVLFNLLDRVPLGHMADFMAQHAGQLRVVRHVVQEPLEHIDEPARAGQGVHLRRVQDLELEGQVPALALCRQAPADALQAGLLPRVLVHAVLPFQLLPRSPPHLDFPLLADHGGLYRLGRHRRQGEAQDRHGQAQDFPKLFHDAFLKSRLFPAARQSLRPGTPGRGAPPGCPRPHRGRAGGSAPASPTGAWPASGR